MRGFLLATTILCSTGEPALSADAVPVTVNNFARAETDRYFTDFVRKAGGIGKFQHERGLADIAHQTVIRMNRDTLYSFAVVDLDAGPVAITMPAPDGDRFMSVLPINEDHYVVGDVLYGGGTHTISKDDASTRYLALAVRTLVNPNDPADLAKVHALQDQMKLTQEGAGAFEVPRWDEASLTGIRNALLELERISSLGPRAFGSKDQVDPLDHLIGTAAGWGGNPPAAATYAGGKPEKNDGKTIYKLHVADVPVDGFWSVSVYNAKGFFEPNDLNAYSINNITAKKSADGAVDIQFGGCDGKIPNCVPVVAGWNYAVRLYRPRAEILAGTWKFPEAQPVG